MMDDFTLKNTKILHKFIECDSCGEPNPPTKCSRCKLVFYCNAACQKKHWKVHKPSCYTPDELKMLIYGDRGNIQEERAEQESYSSSAAVLNSSCGICMEEEIKEKVVLPNCGHAFCFLCLKEWQTSYHSRDISSYVENFSQTKKGCPICRTDIGSNVTEIAANRAILLASRADSMQKSQQQEKNELYHEALNEINKLLQTDENNIALLTFKGQMAVHSDPHEAISTYKKALQLDSEAFALHKILKDLETQINTATIIGDNKTALCLRKQFDEIFTDCGGHIGMIGSGPFRLYHVKLLLAEAYEKATMWNEAMQIYVELIDGVDSLNDVGIQQSRKMFSGLSRCSYHLGLYETAILGGQTSLRLNRHLPGVHQLIALPLQKQGKFNAAMKIISHGVLYEAPFDDLNRKENITLLQDICREGDIDL